MGDAAAARARRLLLAAFGGLWLVDGLLEFRPEMGMNALAMVAMGGWAQPLWLVRVIDALIDAIYARGLAQPLALALGAVQVAIGGAFVAAAVAVLPRRVARLALVASLPLAAAIWLVGEWVGGLFAFWQGGASYLQGGPGAVVLYAAAAVVLLPTGERLGLDVWTRLGRVAGGLWLLGAAAQAVPALWSGPALSQGFTQAQVLTPQGWWTTPIAAVARLAADAPLTLNAALVAAFLALGLGLLVARDQLWPYALAALVLAFVWWCGENFGALPSAAATDPNSAPAWAAFLLPLATRAIGRAGRARAAAAGGRPRRPRAA
jgi:hypothetical protein